MPHYTTFSVTVETSTCERLISAGIDLALVADLTKSIGPSQFQVMKEFLVRLASEFEVSEEGSHVALITYHREATVLNNFTKASSYNKQDLLDLIHGIPMKLSSPTRTDRALMAAADHLFTAAGGDRPEAPNVLVLLTDGRTHKASKPYDEIIPLLKVS